MLEQEYGQLILTQIRQKQTKQTNTTKTNEKSLLNLSNLQLNLNWLRDELLLHSF